MASDHQKTATLRLSGEKITIGFEDSREDQTVWYQNEMMPEPHYLGDTDVDLLIAALVNAKQQKKERFG